MRRNIALLILLLAVLPTTWLRADRVLVVPNSTLTFAPEHVVQAPLKPHLGKFRLENAWQMTLGSWMFGGYSSLVALPDGRFLAISDSGAYLAFTPPGGRPYEPRYGSIAGKPGREKLGADIESATRDPVSGTLWLGAENTNKITRLNSHWTTTGAVRPRAMAHWGGNTGPEAMTRLRDGRFVVLGEAPSQWWRPSRHDAVLFPGDPIENPDAARHFTFEGPTGFDPVDMVQLPDGRLLVLMRTLVWPFPMRWAGRIAIGDPADIKPGGIWRVTEVARLASSLPIDNFEGISVTSREDGKLNVWLISDDNLAKLQRTLLWQFVVDPRNLPG